MQYIYSVSLIWTNLLIWTDFWKLEYRAVWISDDPLYQNLNCDETIILNIIEPVRLQLMNQHVLLLQYPSNHPTSNTYTCNVLNIITKHVTSCPCCSLTLWYSHLMITSAKSTANFLCSIVAYNSGILLYPV